MQKKGKGFFMHRILGIYILLNGSLLYAEGAPYTWSGQAVQNNLMNQAGNWVGGQVPSASAGNYLIFPASPPNLTINNDIGPFTLGVAGALLPNSLSLSDGYTLGGNSFIIPSGGGQITFGGASVAKINTGLNLDGNLVVIGSSTLNQLGGQITGTGGLIVVGDLVMSYGSSSSPTNFSGTTSVGDSSGQSGTLYAGANNCFSKNSPVIVYPGSTLSLGATSSSFSAIIPSLSQGSGTGNAMISLGNGTLTIQEGNGDFGGIISAQNGGLTLSSGTMNLLSSNANFSSKSNPATVSIASTATLGTKNANALGLGSPGGFVNLIVDGTLNLSDFPLIANTVNGSGSIDLTSALLTISAGGTFSGQISGSGGIVVDNASFTLSNPENLFTGIAAIGTGGTLVLSHAGTISHSSGLSFAKGEATLSLEDNGFNFPLVSLEEGTNALVELSSHTATFSNITESGGEASSFTIEGPGTLTIGGTSSYHGSTYVNNATLVTSSENSLSPLSAIELLSNATLDLNNLSNEIASLSGSTGTSLELGSATLTLTNGSTDDSFYGTVAGTGTLAVTGGTSTFMNPNNPSFTGKLSIANSATLNFWDLDQVSTLEFPGTSSEGGSIVFGQDFSSATAIDINGAPLGQYNGTLSPNTYSITLSGDIHGSEKGNLVLLGPGSTTLSGTMTSSPFAIYLRGGLLNVTNTSLGTSLSPAPLLQFDTFGGTLQAGEDLHISNTSQTITISNVLGTFDPNGHTFTIDSIVEGANGVLLLNDSANTPGKLILTNNANNYSGSTYLYRGTLNAVPGSIPGTNGTALSPQPQMVFGGLFAPTSANPVFQCGADFSLFAPAIVLLSDGTIDLNGHDMTVTGNLAGSSSTTFYITDSTTPVTNHTLTLNGTSSYAGTYDISHAKLKAGSTQAFGPSSTLDITAQGSVDLNSFNNTIGSLLGEGPITLGTNAILTISNGNNNSYTGNISDTTSSGIVLTQGNLTLGGTNSYHGPTTLENGTLSISASSAISPSSAFILENSSILNLDGHNATLASLSGTSGSVSLGSNAILTIANGNGNSFSGNITGTTGSGLTLQASSGTQILGGNNSYPGTTTLQTASTLQASSTTAFSLSSDFNILGTLDLHNFSNQVGSIQGLGSIELGTATLTINNGKSQSFTGTISGSGGLSLNAGILTLSGNNSYSGPTTVKAATLIAENDSTSPFGSHSAITVSQGGTLNFGAVRSLGMSDLGNLTNQASVIADLSNVTATGLSMGSYTQSTTASLSLNLPTDPLETFLAMDASSANLAGSLTITNLTNAGKEHPIILMQTGSNQLNGTFSSTTLPEGYSLQYDYADGQLFLQGGDPSITCNASWNFPGTAFWDTSAHWTSCVPGITPTQHLDSATFPDLSSSNAVTITLATSDGLDPQNVQLYALHFNSSQNSYNLLPYVASSLETSILTLDGNISPKPRITVSEGSHSIYVPIQLNKDSRFSLGGTLTMGLFSSIQDGTTSATLYISEDSKAGSLENYGVIFPSNIHIQGCSIENFSSIAPTESLTIQALLGNESPLSLHNYGSIFSPSITIDGSQSTTTIINEGSGTPLFGLGEMATTSQDFLIESVSLQNSLGGQIFAADGQTLTLSNVTLSNDATSIVGSSSSNLHFSSGTLSTLGQILAKGYEQEAQATLSLNLTGKKEPLVLIQETASLNGTLNLNALPEFPTTLKEALSLIYDPNGFSSHFQATNFHNFPSTIIPEIIYTSTDVLLNSTPITPPSHTVQGPKLLFSSINQHNSVVTRKIYQMLQRIPTHTSQELAQNWIDLGDLGLILEDELMAKSSFSMTRDPVMQQKIEKLAKKENFSRPWNLYFGPTATCGHISSQEDQPALDYASSGLLLGFDTLLPRSEESALITGLGAVVEYRNFWANASLDQGSINANRIHGSIYGTIVPSSLPELYFDFVAGCVYSYDTIQRNTGYQNSIHPEGSTTEAVFDALFGTEFCIDHRFVPSLGNFSITPLFHMQYAYDHISGYQETNGGIYNLDVASQNLQSLLSSLGARFDYLLKTSSFEMIFEIDAEWQYQYLHQDQNVSVTAINFNNATTQVATTQGPRNSLLTAFDLFTTLSNGWNFEGNTTFQWNDQAYDFFFYAGIGKEF